MNIRLPLVLLLTLAASSSSVAAPPAGAAQAGRTPQVQFQDFRLPNGLRVILAPDHSAPVVAISVTYNVGSWNERPGRTGFAHLFEHLMFQGSENVGRGEFFQLVNDTGGSFNGTTNQDRTNFFETLPANQLDLGLYLEADRLRALDISPFNLTNQRLVVKEERRQRVDNQPYGAADEAMLAEVYARFPYQHSTIGSMKDLDAATLDDVRAFHDLYYAPNNACLAVVGDFDPHRARDRVQQYFGPIPRHPTPEAVDAAEPLGNRERRTTIHDRLARLPRYMAGYLTVPGSDPDYYALNLLGAILSRGRSGRLYQALVEPNLALNVMAGGQESRGPGLFRVSMTLPPDGDMTAAEAALDKEIRKVQDEGVTEQELERVKTQARVQSINRLQTALGRANTLSQYAVFYDDPGRINTLLPRLLNVSAADIQRVARKYLTPENRSVVIVEPETQE